jgi:signal transduction histidine kinase
VRIEQVLVNLIGNAIKYSDPHSAIAVEIRRVDDEVHVRITNTCPQIPRDEVAVEDPGELRRVIHDRFEQRSQPSFFLVDLGGADRESEDLRAR